MTPELEIMRVASSLCLATEMRAGLCPVPVCCTTSEAMGHTGTISKAVAPRIARYINRHRPLGLKGYRRLEEKIQKWTKHTAEHQKVEATVGGACGFFPIFILLGEVLISWIAKRLLDWWWNRPTEAVCAAAAGLPDVEGDDDE